MRGGTSRPQSCSHSLCIPSGSSLSGPEEVDMRGPGVTETFLQMCPRPPAASRADCSVRGLPKDVRLVAGGDLLE